MAEVKWIKITTDIFDDEKVLLIESLPERDSLLVIWFKLLCMAGRQNNSGVFMLNDRIAYTDEMLATIFRRPLNTVRLALTTFENYGMIEIIDNVITIPKWEKHQNLDGMEKIKEQNRARVAKHREKQRLLACNSEMTCQYCGDKATGVDHIIALSRGGKDIESNKIPCCIECNRIKNDKPLVDFLNQNRERINDEIVLSNSKLSQFVSLCNVTDRYIVMLRNATDKEEEKEKNKNKKKNNKKEDALDLLTSLLPSFILSDSVKSKMTEWVLYKAERKDFYTETGLKSLLRQVEKNCKAYDEQTVMELIDECMCNLYKGIIFDKLKTMKKDSPKQQKPTETPEFLKKWSV